MLSMPPLRIPNDEGRCPLDGRNCMGMGDGGSGNEVRPNDARLLSLLAYWRSLADPPDLPRRSLFRPQHVTPILPELALLDVQDEGRSLRFRLVGTHIVNGIGADLTGTALHELAPSPLGDLLLALADRAIRSRAPAVIGPHRLAFRKHVVTLREALALPMAEDGQKVDKLLLALLLLPLSRIGPLSL